MKSRLLALASAALVARRGRGTRRAAPRPSVVISQVAFRGPAGGNDEVDRDPQRLGRRGRHRRLGAVGLQQQHPARGRARARRCPRATTLPAGKTYVFANSAGALRRSAATSRYGTGIVDTGGVQLRNAAGTVMDAVGSTAVQRRLPRGRGAAVPDRRRGQRRVRPQDRRHAGHRRQRRRTSPARRRSPPRSAARPAPARAARAVRPGPDGTTPITEHPDARRQRRVQRHDGHGPRHRHRHRRPLRLELRERLQGRLGHLGAERRRATRRPRRRARCSSPASAATRPTPTAVHRQRHHDHRPGRDQVRPGRSSCPPASATRATRTRRRSRSTASRRRTRRQQPLPGAGRARARRTPRPRTRSPARTTAACRACACTLPVGIATGGGTTKFRDVFVEPGTTRPAPVPQEQPGGDRHAVVGRARRARHRARRRRAQPGRPAPDVVQRRRRSTSTCSTSSATSSAR